MNATDQRLQMLDEAGIYSLQALRVACNVQGQEGQELSDHRIITFRGFSTGQYYFAAGADGVVNLVARRTDSGTVVW